MVFGKDGRETTGFAIELRRTAVDERSTETKGTVVLGNGSTIPVYQRMTASDQGVGFRLDTNRGKGGGYCLGAGLCESYEDAGNGQAFATTLINVSSLRELVGEGDRRYFAVLNDPESTRVPVSCDRLAILKAMLGIA